MTTAEHRVTAPEDRIRFTHRLAYGAGAFVNNLLAAASGGLMIVLNLGLGMNPALVGLLGAIPRLTDAITDPIMGYVSDGTRSRWGRRRPWIVAGAPVLDERLFFGRERLIQRVLQTIHNNSLLLYGERRIGKTSLLHQLKRRLGELDDPTFAFFSVFVDLQGTPEERFFATLGSEVVEELGARLPPGTVETPSPSGEYGYRELVADLRAVIDALARTTSKRVKLVLLIDEVDELNAYDPRINQRLRSLFMRAFSEHLVAVVSGVEIRRQWEQHGSPWYNFFEELEVTAIDCADAEALVRTPLRGVFSVEDEAVTEILARTGCKPYPIQKACVALVDRLHQQGKTVITRADVDAVLGTGAL